MTQLEDLQLLVSGPPTFYRHFLVTGYEVAAFQIALDFDFFVLVPADGSISLEELAKKAGLDMDRTGMQNPGFLGNLKHLKRSKSF